MEWIEQHIWLINLSPRESGYNALSDSQINENGARLLADAAEEVWKAIASKDLKAFGASVRKSFEAQITMFPHMGNPNIL